jgi:hypothetical protein
MPAALSVISRQCVVDSVIGGSSDVTTCSRSPSQPVVWGGSDSWSLPAPPPRPSVGPAHGTAYTPRVAHHPPRPPPRAPQRAPGEGPTEGRGEGPTLMCGVYC